MTNVRHKSEENYALAESELDKQTNIVNDLTRKVDELQVKADEAARLKDQMDEYVPFFAFVVRLYRCSRSLSADTDTQRIV